MLHYTKLITLHYATLNYATLHYATRRYITLHYYTNYNYSYSYNYATLDYTRLHYTILHYSTQHYRTVITLDYATAHNTTAHYTTSHDTKLITPHHNYNCNFTTLITLHTTAAPLHYNHNYSCTTPHYIQQLWLQPLQPLQKTQLQPPFGLSVDSLCHPCITTTHFSYSVLSFKLPPPPCAVALVVSDYVLVEICSAVQGGGRFCLSGHIFPIAGLLHVQFVGES